MRQAFQQFLETIYDFRQFITFTALLIVAVVFRLINMINGSEFVDLMKNVTVALFAIHGVGHLITVGKDFITAKYQQGGDGDDQSEETSSAPKGS